MPVFSFYPRKYSTKILKLKIYEIQYDLNIHTVNNKQSSYRMVIYIRSRNDSCTTKLTRTLTTEFLYKIMIEKKYVTQKKTRTIKLQVSDLRQTLT